ncbi:NUDIX domain-containing protein [Corticibacter populi]|uniref:NUDIX domain-containing protein n=1 Tax=Corticibacter populi TaxID=1550736 RepID=A0A3M6QUF8_9BURK|nr:bifunctional nicotinamide-nucleotide adenylyltransferase/Nudix hydroxylase [Corticibacter populi]RMX06603.1 NUDIX domain-containing protein [Corticibacter populi]RZS31827.1 bifunctional NMN adenylyltransferase/nudix hydrolase [Corticibacter populi]
MADFDAAVFIGRFQPPHRGHMAMLRHALDAASRVVVVLGSAHQSRMPKNPFTWQERRAMIEAALAPADRQRVLYLPMRDFYDEARWVQAVRNGVRLLLDSVRGGGAAASAGPAPQVALVGHFKDDSSAYLAQFPDWQLLNFPRQSDTDATLVREACFAAADDHDPHLQAVLHEHVPPAVRDWLLAWRHSTEFASLRQEWQMLRDYRQSWASAPFTPMFVTVDALVQCQGHVLLIERGRAPGKGLLALPGGFLEPRDTLWQSCLRELMEETAIGLSEAEWKSAFRTVRVFDHPDRSQRGRTITHAFHFDLGHVALPPVQGGDDAQSAAWVPIQQIGTMPERFFEDHFFILDVFLQLTHEVALRELR